MSALRRHWPAFFAGFRITLPFQSGVIPFGLLYATIAVSVGLPPWLILFITIAVYAGSSQLVFVDLLQHLSSPLQAVLGSNIVNARHLIYSAGVSREFALFPRRWRLLLAYLLTDQLYAIAESQKERTSSMSPEDRRWFYAGSGFCTWSFWVAACAAGIFFGRLIPPAWNLGFSIPLIFMPLVFGLRKSVDDDLACLFAVGLIFVLHRLPYGLGIMAAILGASLAAFAIRKVRSR